VQHLEFTIEPFVEGKPGPHVVAAVEAVSELGADVEFGPVRFGLHRRRDADARRRRGRDPSRVCERRDARQPRRQ
jgi:hypothetical protein